MTIQPLTTERPNIKFCPQCAGSNLQRPIGNRLICRTCGFILYFNTAASVATLIRDDQDRYIIAVRAHDPQKGTWDLPGGFVNPGESAEQAVTREIYEELGISITTMQFITSLPNTYLYKDVLYHTLDLFFLCDYADLEQAGARDDVSEILILPRNDIDPDRFGFRSMQTFLKAYLA